MFAAAPIMSSNSTAVASGLSVGASDQKNGIGNALAAHALVGVTAGALLIVMTAISGAGFDCTVTSSPSLTWTKQVDDADTSVELHTAVFTAGGSINVTPAWNDTANAYSVCQIVTGQEAVLGGASAHYGPGTPPSFGDPVTGDILTTRINSIIFGVIGDRNGLAGTIAYLDTPTQIYAQTASNPCFFTFYKSAPTIATHTMGLTTPAGGARQSMCLYEVRTP